MSRHYGLNKSDPKKRVEVNRYVPLKTDAPQLPVAVDLRSKFPPVWDQGQTSACTSFATCAAIAYHNNALNPSRAFLYWQERTLDGDPGVDGGSTLDTAIRAAQQYGSPNESLWPFTPQNLFTAPPQTIYPEAQWAKVVQASRVDSIQEYKTALADGFPVVIGIQVFPYFESGEMAYTGTFPMSGVTGQPIGGHAICMVGYDDHKQSFLIRNSWGTDWGQQGYFWMPYDFIGNSQLAWDGYSVEKIQNNMQDVDPFDNGSSLNPSWWQRALNFIRITIRF